MSLKRKVHKRGRKMQVYHPRQVLSPLHKYTGRQGHSPHRALRAPCVGHRGQTCPDPHQLGEHPGVSAYRMGVEGEERRPTCLLGGPGDAPGRGWLHSVSMWAGSGRCSVQVSRGEDRETEGSLTGIVWRAPHSPRLPSERQALWPLSLDLNQSL